MGVEDGYLPVSCYGIIGNLRTAVLIGRDGSIDWCCFPHTDSASVFAALLDHRRGGRFMVRPRGSMGVQDYVEDTNVLRTVFKQENGEAILTDFMPLWRDITLASKSYGPPEVHRMIECTDGRVEIEVEWSPRFDYARKNVRISATSGGWIAQAGADLLSLGGVTPEEAGLAERGATLLGRFVLRSGERRALVTRWGTQNVSHDVHESEYKASRTEDAWRWWTHSSEPVHDRRWAGDWYPLLIRSELALKLLVYAESGAMVAAPTTSLPEAMGGGRNYDYRYAWLRDASLTAQAFVSLGHEKEAMDFLNWIEEVSEVNLRKGKEPQIMYGIHGESELDEIELQHLEGYRGSWPVRIGNAAAQQRQLEVYGELLNTAYELARRGFELREDLLRFLTEMANTACRMWKEPDHGIWEVRGKPRHFVYSKVMLWVALDRAIQLKDLVSMAGDRERWWRVRDDIKNDVLENGFDDNLGAFVQSYGVKKLDAANLRIPLLEFLPLDDERVKGTIDRSLEMLTENGLVHRYRGDDLAHWGEEGAFAICTCWMIDALALTGRTEEAWSLFHNLARHANRLGLLSEQIDPRDGSFLGNYPQAFTHIGLINNIFYLRYSEGKYTPPYPLMGTREHRKQAGRACPVRNGIP